MKIIFKNENVIVEKEEQQGKSEIFVRALKGDLLAAHSLAVQVNYLQEQKDLLSDTVMQMQGMNQPIATLEHTSEPDIRHYHFYAEHNDSGWNNAGVFTLNISNPNNENTELFDDILPKIQNELVSAFYNKNMLKTNPEDWVVKSLSRL